MADEGKDALDNETAKEQKSKKRRLLILGAVGGLLVLGAGGGAAFFLSQGGSGSSGVEMSASSVGTMATDLVDDHTEPKEAAPAEAGRPAPAGAASRSGEGSVSDLGIDFGETYKMKPFHLNLGNALENRYVRLEVTLEFSGGDPQKQEIERRLPQLRDAVISIVSRKTREFLLAPDGKDALRKEILIRINRYMKTKIDAVYITDILIE